MTWKTATHPTRTERGTIAGSPRARRRRSVAIVGMCALAMAVGVAACGDTDTSESGASATATTPAKKNFKGLVDVGNGRKMFVECRGQGSPTVVLIAGKGNGADDWMQILAPNDPSQTAPGDDLPFGKGKLVHSRSAVFPSVSRFTRVCTYDRPDIRTKGPDVTTPRPRQPHTVDLDVDDLHALLNAAGERGPYVLVAHSYGGLIATLYARTYPKSVAGLVMVDTVTQLMEKVATPAQLRNWDKTNAATSPQVREGVKLIDAFKKINAAAPMPKVPAVVLSADKPWRVDLLPPEVRKTTGVTFDNWLASLNRLSAALGAKHITKTESGHDIYLYKPALVIDAIREVVDDARQR